LRIDIVEWGISEGAFVAILALATIALCGLVSTLKADDSPAT
jgi:hypothetical protein